MAELAGEFLTERLNSRQLLALLFICASKRKNTLPSISFGGGARPAAWIEFVERFGARLAKLPESERAYLTGSHLHRPRSSIFITINSCRVYWMSIVCS